MFESYIEKKEKILMSYSQLLEYNLVPIGNYTKEKIKNMQKELEEEKFIVSFCGQIKSGKSTLINTLLFGEEILPTSPTPHTAKITIIRYDNIARFDAEFYSPHEWDELLTILENKECQKEENYYQLLKKEVNARIKQGIYPDQVLGKVVKKEGLKDLNDFVGANGKFTPFTKQCYVYYPNQILKHLIVADTPGINDPNPFRSKITLDWINKSDAIVYVVYAGQAFSKSDIDFINEYLCCISPQLMIFAINQIDKIDNLDELQLWIQQVRSQPELKIREIMMDEESTVMISALGGLISKLISKYNQLEDFPENMREVGEKLAESDYLNEDKHGIKKLERIIEKKLITQKRNNILISHKRKIEHIITENIKKINKKIENKIIYLKELEENTKDRKKEIKEIENKEKEIETALENVNNNLEEIIAHKWINRINEVKKIQDKSKIFIDQYVEEIKNYDNLIYNTIFICKKTFYEFKDNLLSIIKKIIEDVELEVDDYVKEIAFKYSINTFFIKEPAILSWFLNKFTDDLLIKIDNEIDEDIEKKLKEIKEINKKKFLIWIRKKKSLENAKEDIKRLLKEKFLDYIEKDLKKLILRELRRKFNEKINNLNNELINQIMTYKNILREVEKKLNERQSEQERLQKCIEKLNKEKDKLEKIKNSIWMELKKI